MRTPALVIGGLAALTLALHLRDPHQHASWGLCPSAALGVYCPGCGGLRAVNDLTHGDVGAAASSNLLLVVLMPALVALLALWAADRWRGRTRSIDGPRARAVLIGLGVVAAAFTVLRNLPAGAWLAP
ncbi:DUF2752 domain-containing protein [Nocardioides sp. MAH-18]|uniref:DUF2752 domain-containing protein n=1 Tax=Nocardioides agri TaxID=2682843 RepID=A0A6L6XXJ8_9ACTN|nr:DUF2752 domain-containing protein [Nocardioides sp. CGMCC 1.13656]MBA2952352.1 DUF2752 domain-containing protein [Nocardioides sp. CGMCC 1.13656]MVQ51512.1 DUF2752 domain-containing protein [Nocardioides sp. MAH-18]